MMSTTMRTTSPSIATASTSQAYTRAHRSTSILERLMRSSRRPRRKGRIRKRRYPWLTSKPSSCRCCILRLLLQVAQTRWCPFRSRRMGPLIRLCINPNRLSNATRTPSQWTLQACQPTATATSCRFTAREELTTCLTTRARRIRWIWLPICRGLQLFPGENRANHKGLNFRYQIATSTRIKALICRMSTEKPLRIAQKPQVTLRIWIFELWRLI